MSSGLWDGLQQRRDEGSFTVMNAASTGLNATRPENRNSKFIPFKSLDSATSFPFVHPHPEKFHTFYLGQNGRRQYPQEIPGCWS
jgi:hypothetical protein